MTPPPQSETPPLENHRLHWTLSFASGYLKLGMVSEAARELSQLEIADLTRSDVIDLRIQVMLARRHWRRAQDLARAAMRLFPGMLEFYRHAAIASEGRGDLEEAKRIWCSAPSLFHQSGYFHYKIAVYEAQMGNTLRAQECMKLAIRLDPAIKSDLGKIDHEVEPPVT